MSRPHDTPAGHNPDVRDLTVEVLSDQWYTLRRASFEIRGDDGAWRRERREAYDRGNGVAALLHDADRDTVLLVRQYRVPVHLNDHPDGMLLEVPAGLVDAGEDAEEAVRRELVEEVGLDGGRLERLWTLYMSPGSVTEHVTHFLGTYAGSPRTGGGGGGGGGGVADEGEQVDIVELPLADAIAMVDDGRIADAKTVLLLRELASRFVA